MSELIKVGITHGDVNGVGYEILMKAFSDTRILELFHPIVYGSSKSASYHRKVLQNDTVNFHIISKVEESHSGKVNLVNCVREETKIELGSPSPEAGEAAYTALDVACRDLDRKSVV